MIMLFSLYKDSFGLVRRPHQGYVKLVFEGPDGEHVHLMRLIAPKGTSAETYSSQYKINDRIVTVDAYIKKLESYNILVKARNFLVFQVSVSWNKSHNRIDSALTSCIA